MSQPDPFYNHKDMLDIRLPENTASSQLMIISNDERLILFVPCATPPLPFLWSVSCHPAPSQTPPVGSFNFEPVSSVFCAMLAVLEPVVP